MKKVENIGSSHLSGRMMQSHRGGSKYFAHMCAYPISASWTGVATVEILKANQKDKIGRNLMHTQ